MSEMDDRQLDAQLRQHLSKLDGQLGRASVRFTEERRDAMRWPRGGWIAAAISSAVAAGLAIALVAQNWRKTPSVPFQRQETAAESNAATPIAPKPRPLAQFVAWRTHNDGLVTVDDVPMRRLRQQIVREVRWYDRQHNRLVNLMVPSEQVVLVPVRTY